MKAALILSLAFSAAAGAADAPVRTTPFPDVPRDHWAFDAVESLRQNGIIRGYPPSQRFSVQPREMARELRDKEPRGKGRRK